MAAGPGNTLVLNPLANGSFELQVNEAAGGRLKHTHTWPTTKLVTLCGRAAGFERYDEMPYAAEPAELGFLLSPNLWPVWADAAQLKHLDVRHGAEEGKGLKALRNGLRVHFGDISPTDTLTVEDFLREVQATVCAIKADDSLMETLLRELKEKSQAAERVLLRLYGDKKYGTGSKESKRFVTEGTGTDPGLPPRLQKIQTTLSKEEPASKRPRIEDSAATKKNVAADEFYCRCCNKVLKKSEGDAHKKDPVHIANKKKR